MTVFQSGPPGESLVTLRASQMEFCHRLRWKMEVAVFYLEPTISSYWFCRRAGGPENGIGEAPGEIPIIEFPVYFSKS